MDETDEIFLVLCVCVCVCVYFLHWTEKNVDWKLPQFSYIYETDITAVIWKGGKKINFKQNGIK